ncbi:hypothetical protein K2173_014060 [Erythroxylum novogranatense]|uniref:BIG2 domain-containing protein n=1 Tax=Erythroxylum novogranatense TaxID=1862640 RepID=A0AAV8SD84_9ROSI|nr:hypothetical protein K2173_014060 [Erythroxylum novogranatense]
MPRVAVMIVILLLLLAAGCENASLSSSGPHITDVNILLPPKMTHAVQYRLQGSDGCFKWSWDHHDILSVIPEYNKSNQCSTSARLRSIAPFSGRKETAVYATDLHTGIVIRCKVFIDNIIRIQIFHNSVKLDLDGLATLRVRAFDSEDNVFSSLVGLQFMWRLIPELIGSPHHLAHVPIKESPLSDFGGLSGDLNIQIELEDSGFFSDLYVVKGIGIGQENVFVHLLEPQFEQMADKIVLTVVEAMSLEPPSPVFVLIGAAFHYCLKVIRGNTPQVVTLPSKHHRWFAANSSVAVVDTMKGFTQALGLGVTNIIVEDTRVAGHVHVSSLNVVIPHSLCLYILPLSAFGYPVEGTKAIPSIRHWYVVSGRQYLVESKVFSQGPDAQEIYITKNDDLKLYDEQSEHLITLSRPVDIADESDWHSRTILRASSEGLGKLIASLTFFSGHKTEKEVLKFVQEIVICDQVKFSLDRTNDTAQKILLPWVPAVYQELELKAIGGCAKASSDYKWVSSDLSVLSVSASGVVQAKNPGEATIRVVSTFDVFNFDEVVIEVTMPSSMTMLQNFPVETVVGSQLQAAVTLKASNGAYFYKCDAFHSVVKWKAVSDHFIVVNATEPLLSGVEPGHNMYGPPCSWTYVYASGSGQTMLHATLLKEYHHLDLSLHGPNVLKASSRIAAYPPLTLLQMSDGNQFGGYWFDFLHVDLSKLENLEKLYLVPGTSLDVMLLGGPEKWDKGVNYIDTVDILDGKHGHPKDGLHVHQVSRGYQSVYRVLCQSFGNYKLAFKRGNSVGDDHPLPEIAEAMVSVMCAFPTSIALVVDEPVNKLDVIRAATLADCGTEHIRVTPITVANGRTIRIAAVGIDTSGEAFANSSSISMKWELIGCEGLAHWDHENESKTSKYNWERFLVLQNDSGQCIVRAAITGFGDKIASDFPVQVQSSENILTDAVRLQLVSSLRVNPVFNLLFFNPDAKVNLSISGGSSFLEAVVNDSQVVDVFQPSPGLQCLQLTIYPKGLGTALVTVYDIGLTPPIAASATVQVADIDWIKIVSGDEIRLMEGQSHSIDLLAGISDGITFDSSQYAYMDIHVFIEDQFIELVDNDNALVLQDGYLRASQFKIVAKSLGMTTLHVSARQQSGHEITSQPIKVEIYEPLRIHPHDIFLVPGASYMLSVNGGPTVGAHIEYSSMDDGIVAVERSSGRLSAISPGNTTIFSTVYGSGHVVICQAYATIKVGVPSSAILSVQSEQLDIGLEMPVYPSFSEGDLFSFYEVCGSYNWTIDDTKVLNLYVTEGLHSEKWLPLDDDKELGFVKVLHGRSAGRSNVAVTFLCEFVSPSYSEARFYDASVSIFVVPGLPLALGVPITWVLPPHYVTSELLPSSTELHGQWDSKSRKGTIIYSLIRSYAGKEEIWQKDGITINEGRIRTTESDNLACIQAKERLTGRMEIASCVRVAEVTQIRIRNKEFPIRVIFMAVGSELDLPIGYLDALGNPFYEAHNAIPYYVETNHHDIVSILDKSNGSMNIHLKAMRHGRALVRASINRNAQKSDYVLISVGAHIYPSNPVLRQGASLNFSVKGIDKVSGHWHSSNHSVISIDMQSGKAEAVGLGSSQVIFKCSGINLQTAVTVISGNVISIDVPEEMLTNVPYPTKGYSFSVKFSDTCDKFEAIGNGKEMLYDCKVDPPYVGYAKPWVNLDNGNSYCVFFPYSPEHLARSIPRSKDMRPYISFSVSASIREANHISGSVSAIFIGGFSILDMNKDSGHLNLTPDSNKTTITILGNTDVEIYWHDRDHMKISPIHKEDFGIGGRAEYEVEVQSSVKLKDKIIIILPANGQRVVIDVSYEPGSRAGTKTLSSETLWPLVLGFIVLVVLTIATVMFVFEISNRYRPSGSVSVASPSLSAPITPERGRTSVSTEQSPRTPQPFVDYVRRTIDETPYYKREARRRVNPQNTY